MVTQAVKRSMAVLLSLILQFREVHARETKLNSGTREGGGGESHLSLCMKLPKTEFGCTYVCPPNVPLTGWASCPLLPFCLSIQY